MPFIAATKKKSKCPKHTCKGCGDALIHQNNRGIHESSSGLGQFVHDKLPVEFFWADADGDTLKNATRILRKLEHKPVGGRLSRGQLRILPLYARMFDLAIERQLIHPDSGVFLVESDPPHTRGWVTKVTSNGLDSNMRVFLGTKQWRRFLCAEFLDFDPWAELSTSA